MAAQLVAANCEQAAKSWPLAPNDTDTRPLPFDVYSANKVVELSKLDLDRGREYLIKLSNYRSKIQITRTCTRNGNLFNWRTSLEFRPRPSVVCSSLFVTLDYYRLRKRKCIGKKRAGRKMWKCNRIEIELWIGRYWLKYSFEITIRDKYGILSFEFI